MEKICSKNKLNKKNILFILILSFLSFILIYELSIKFSSNKSNNDKIGHNMSSQEIEKKILEISSYEAIIEMTVHSNKNINKYKIKQVWKNEKDNYQEVLEPTNIQGIKIIRESDKLIIENSRLKLSSLIENYSGITRSEIDLISFLEDYRIDKNRKIIEEENEVTFETKIKSENKYFKSKSLVVDKYSAKPLKMKIKMDNQKELIDIIYKEINI